MSAARQRIVILTEDSKPATGGVAEYLHQLATALAATHDVEIVTSVAGAETRNQGIPFRYREVPWFRGQAAYAGDSVGAVRRANTVAWYIGRRRRVRELLRGILAERADTSVVLGRVSSVTEPWRVACEALGVPYAAIGYGRELMEPLGRADARRRRAAVLGARHWFPVSEYTRGVLAGYGVPEAHMTVLPPAVAERPVPSDAVRRSVREQLGLGHGRFILSVCMLRPRKGIDLAIRAFAEVIPEFPGLRYVVVGEGPERGRLEALSASLGLTSNIMFVGEVPDVARDALFSECEFFVMPNRRVDHDVEGFGMVFLEAAWFGKAAIGGHNGGVAEAIENEVTGLLVDTDNGAGELTCAIRGLLIDRERTRHLGTRGRARVVRDFTCSARARAFRERLDVLSPGGIQEWGRDGRVKDPPLHVRTGVGVALRLAREGRLWEYAMQGGVSADLGACRAAVLDWVRRALRTGDGGAPAEYHVVAGWGAPYPEVTGYLIPTLLREGERAAAERAGEWLVRTRLPNGAVCRKQWAADNATPSVFNTAQVLEGWCALAESSGESKWVAPARVAAEWLVAEQEPDGSWVRCAFNGVSHSYYARAASALATFARVTGESQFAEAASRAFDWVLTQQDADGWFERAGFVPDEAPTTHTIGYVLEGLLRGAELLGEPRYRAAAAQAAAALRDVRADVGFLPGQFTRGWRPAARWRCLTGDAQVALAWAMLGRATGDARWYASARATADAVRECVRVMPTWPEVSGAVPGSAPVWGAYDAYAYPTHAAKFTLDLLAHTAA